MAQYRLIYLCIGFCLLLVGCTGQRWELFEIQAEVDIWYNDDFYVGDSISFRTTGGSGNYDLEWDWGDGNTTRGREVVHAYDRPGRYAISVFVYTQTGRLAHTEISYINIQQATSPDARFTMSRRLVGLQEEVVFTPVLDLSIADVDLLWSFGDGTTSNRDMPTKEYDADGYYPVRLTVTNERNESASWTDTLRVVEYATVTIRVQMDLQFDVFGDTMDRLDLVLYNDEIKYQLDTVYLFDENWFKNILLAGGFPLYTLDFPLSIDFAYATNQVAEFTLLLDPVNDYYFHLYDWDSEGYFSNKQSVYAIRFLTYGEKRTILTNANWYAW